MTRAPAIAVTATLLVACSAIVNPDPDRLGRGTDGGAPVDGGGRDAGASSDAGPPCPGGCDDAIPCTDDRCEDGRCLHEAVDARCDGEERCNPVMGCVPRLCEQDAQCDDGAFCNGAERCEPGASDTGCLPGVPVACDDGASCTADACDEDADRCAYTPMEGACGDGVDCTVDRCDPMASGEPSGCVHAPDDGLCAADFCVVGRVCDPSGGCSGGAPRACSDMNPCTVDTCDEAADRCENVTVDADGDGFPAESVMGVACGGSDCDDAAPGVNPGVAEVCGDGIDNNCRMGIDEGCQPDSCADASAIVLDATGAGRATGSLTGLADDYQTSSVCNAQSGGRDAVYYVDLPAGTWDVTIDTNGSTADTVLGVGFACSNAGFQTICNDDQEVGTTTASRIWLHNVGRPGGSTRVFILVDGFRSSTAGAYTLNVQREAAHPDGCVSVSGMGPLDMTGGGSALGVIRGSFGATSGSCQSGFSGSEGVLRFDASGSFEVDVYSADFNPEIYLRRGGCASGTEIGCDNGGSVGGGINLASLNRSVSAGTTVYLFVDNAGSGDAYAVYYRP